MHHRLDCPRCGSQQATSSNSELAWDEVCCAACGEFLETRQSLEERNAPLLIETCLKSQALARDMGLRV
ncbi:MULTISPECIES: hypothetical protein [Salinicola]|uniref:Uncharacterized protein n=1 Tax=Salinicola socius TaxID=404433 RepID=A0A1Q8SWF1_9GAMM|nr:MULTISPECIES: hypothetical protein [Salinicola]OLO05778.1 hypothetical protein BTW07_02195 [Salinicola socius]